jgi:tRNA threonylcarbamoyladenosine biosynthesis protein TsaB
LILAIESATPRGSVALVRGGAVAGEAELSRGRQASETFLPAIDLLLRRTGTDPGSVALVAVSAGPGSFTGLRVGMAAAKGFCLGWGVPLLPVPTLHALAFRLPSAGETVCPVLDARKKEVYAAFFRWEGGRCARLSPDMAISPELLAGRLPPGKILFCGDGAAPFGPFFRERLGERASFAPGEEGLPSAASVGLLGVRLLAEGLSPVDPRTAAPAYVRRSEAELKRTP